LWQTSSNCPLLDSYCPRSRTGKATSSRVNVVRLAPARRVPHLMFLQSPEEENLIQPVRSAVTWPSRPPCPQSSPVYLIFFDHAEISHMAEPDRQCLVDLRFANFLPPGLLRSFTFHAQLLPSRSYRNFALPGPLFWPSYCAFLYLKHHAIFHFERVFTVIRFKPSPASDASSRTRS